jgi:hypothetical protein
VRGIRGTQETVKLAREIAAGLTEDGVHVLRRVAQTDQLHATRRGVFDGDGHGGFYKKRNKRELRIGFTSGSKRFLEDIRDVLPVHIGGPYKGKGRSWALQTTSRDAAHKLRDWMYAGNSRIRSDRKHAKLYKKGSRVRG